MASRKRAEVPAPQTTPTSTALDELTGTLPRLVELPLDQLRSHPSNPRRDLGDLTELADSIRSSGVRQPLTVVSSAMVPSLPKYVTNQSGGPVGIARHKPYVIVMGHRRAAAARNAGLSTVPAIVDESLTPTQQLELMLVENVQRADLSPVEEADGYQGLLDLGLDVDAIAKETGRSESTVRRRLRLVALPEKAREKLHAGQATLAQADRLTEFEDDPELVKQLAKVLGSADFDNEVAKAVKKMTVARAIAHVVEVLTAAGAAQTPARDGDAYQGTSPDGMKMIGYISNWELRDGPDSARVTKWLDDRLPDVDESCVFRVHHSSYDDVVYVFGPLPAPEAGETSSAPPVVDEEFERRQAEIRAEAAAKAEQHQRFTSLRTAFIDGLKARTVTIPQVRVLAEFVAHRDLREVWSGDGGWGSDTELMVALGVDQVAITEQATADELDLDEALDDAVQVAIAQLDTGHALLLSATLDVEKQIHPRAYSFESTQRYYGLLERLGYEISSEEREAVWPPHATPADHDSSDDDDDADDEGWDGDVAEFDD